MMSAPDTEPVFPFCFHVSGFCSCLSLCATNSNVNDALRKVMSRLPGKFASFYVVR